MLFVLYNRLELRVKQKIGTEIRLETYYKSVQNISKIAVLDYCHQRQKNQNLILICMLSHLNAIIETIV